MNAPATLKELRELIGVLRENGVSAAEIGGLKLSLYPMPMHEPGMRSALGPESSEGPMVDKPMSEDQIADLHAKLHGIIDG